MGDVGGELQDGLGDAPSLQDQRGGACVGVEGDEGHDLLQGQREVLGEAVLVGAAAGDELSLGGLQLGDGFVGISGVADQRLDDQRRRVAMATVEDGGHAVCEPLGHKGRGFRGLGRGRTGRGSV